ncbi:hypothetical protein BGZ51_007302 [Haplosporangium sp. Z 767]|nr:hypothetical protein BGZ50_002491 [Haplosporangium sp. Z 11]KAF9191447.1 hypothetical protein BGZ51_007302 [Haplosporangium sp. Z 767]
MPQQQTETESQQAIKADPEERRRASLDESFSIPQKSGSSDSMVAVPKPTNDHNKRINNNGGSDNNGDTNNIPSNDKSEPTSQDAVTINRPADVEPPLKKLKTGSVSTEALKPSPLRSSITKVRIPTTKSSTSAATKESIDEPIDVVSVNDADDQIVSRLSVADTTKANESWNNNKENATTDTNETQTKSNTAGTTGRSRKQNKMNSANGASQSRIMVELSTAKPPSAFVIDKNKRARKWGRSPAAVQTLGGGELILSLWKSDQEMLLNEPRPYFVQRPAPMLSGLGSATATNLARIAVLNQWDNVSSNDTPERGNTPESREMSPTPAAPSSPQKKFKRGSQRQDDGSSTASTGTKRKRNRASSSRGMSAHVDEDMEDSSARSTPAPTSSSPSAGKNPGSRPRAIPTRPRTFPCSFEGCGKAFMDKFHLKRHETRHVTQVIVCGVDGCDKAYDSISTMRRHQSMMHKEWKAQQQLEKQKQKQIQRSKGNKSGDEDDDEDDDDDDDRDGGADDGDDDDNNNNDDDNDNDNEDEEEQQNAQLESFGSSPAPSSTAYTAVSSPIRDQM